MDTIEIKDDNINVEDIMCQIRENVRKGKESGIYIPQRWKNISINPSRCPLPVLTRMT